MPANNTARVAAANFIRDDLSKVGIRVVLMSVDFNTLAANVFHDLQFEAAILGRGVGRPGPLAAPCSGAQAEQDPGTPRNLSRIRRNRRGSIG